jgi:hypothetical protein
MADPVYDDSLLPWWMKSLIESGKSGLEILDERASDALEWTGDVWGAATDSEAERAARKQQNIDEERLEAQAQADRNPGPAYAGIWDGGETYKPVNEYGQAVSGPFSPRAGQGPSQQSTTPEGPKTEEDYLNQLLMASLMKGRKPTYGRQAPSSYGVGATVPFGDAWRMRRTIGGQ